MNKKKLHRNIHNARIRRKHAFSNIDKNKLHIPNITELDHALDKRFGGMNYNLQKKIELDKVLGKDSMNLLISRAAKHFIEAFENCSNSPKKVNRRQQRDLILKDLWDRIINCKMIKYFSEELELPKEYLAFIFQNINDVLEEMLGLRDFKTLVFDNRYPVHLLWEGGCYKIKHNEKIYDLDCVNFRTF